MRRKRTKAEVSAIMRRVRSKGTGPELRLLRALKKSGLALKTSPQDLPGEPGIVIPSPRDYWLKKIHRNIAERDFEVTHSLRAVGLGE